MILYHGSKIIVKKPDIFHSRKRVDFGPGFYVTPLYDQAKKLCMRYIASEQDAYISKYILNDEIWKSNFKILQLETYSDEWLDFVFSCRKGKDKTDYDVVIGGVANDKVFDTVELFFQGLINKNEALGRLRYEKSNAQVCIRNQEVLDRYLYYEGSEKL